MRERTPHVLHRVFLEHARKISKVFKSIPNKHTVESNMLDCETNRYLRQENTINRTKHVWTLKESLLAVHESCLLRVVKDKKQPTYLLWLLSRQAVWTSLLRQLCTSEN